MNKLIYKFILVGILFFVQLNLAIAGPGGKIAKQVFESPFGKILLVIIVLIFLPLFIYIFAKEFFAIRKTKRVLRMMSMKSPKYFDELLLRNRINDVFTRVHYGWSNADITECSEYMSHWYWQNQQIVYLEKWKENNLENICDLKRINSITPIHIRVSDNLNFENSKIVYKISANM